VSTSRFRNYWEKFPSPLRVIIKARLWTAIGAGGVLYLSPLIFNGLGFTAEKIGSGITAAAFAGITSRLGTGYLLDKKYSYRKAIEIACLIAIISDIILFYSQNYFSYISGEFLLGAAAGIYWPSVELAIPLNCNNQINSSEGYTLARSADAIGVALGVLIGTFGTHIQFTRIIYCIDIFCMLYVFHVLKKNLYIFKINECLISSGKEDYKISISKERNDWLFNLIPLLIITLFITGVMSLFQSILPLDLVNGGLKRPPIIDSRVATLIFIKVILLSIFQWPVGYLIRNKASSFKFRFCLISLLTGFIIITISSYLSSGYILILIALLPITFGLCIFLPTGSDTVIKNSPIKYRGIVLAFYSQCFGISALTIPWVAGRLIDSYDSAIQLWIIISIISILLIPICRYIR
tara:strand:- start:4998 stop:6221 length:1224 start_codon:yes stop_codon:yes gene_type:complete